MKQNKISIVFPIFTLLLTFLLFSCDSTPQETKFEPKKGKMRKPSTGCISKINDHLYEGRYSPKDAYGKRMARNIYAPTREECEEKLLSL